MKKLIENWRDYEKSVLKEEVETEGEEEYGFGDFINDMMTVSWDETKENPETGEMEEYVNYALNPAFLPIEQQEELKSSIPLQESGQEISIRQHYIDRLKTAPSEEALQEADTSDGLEFLRDPTDAYSMLGQIADYYDWEKKELIKKVGEEDAYAILRGDKEYKMTSGHDPLRHLDPSYEEAEIFETPDKYTGGSSPFSGRPMSRKQIEASNNLDLGGGFTMGDLKKEMAFFALGGPMTSGVRNIFAKAAESGMGRKAATYLVTLGSNLKKPYDGAVDILMSGGKMAKSAISRIMGNPSAKFTDDLAAWRRSDNSFADMARRLHSPEKTAAHAASKPIHTPWFQTMYRNLAQPFKTTKDALGTGLSTVKGVVRDPTGTVKKIGTKVISVSKNALLSTGRLLRDHPYRILIPGLGAFAGDQYLDYQAEKKVNQANKINKATNIPDIKGVNDPKPFNVPQKVQNQTPGVNTPILPAKKEEKKLKPQKTQQESVTRTEEIVREEVVKFLSNRRKK